MSKMETDLMLAANEAITHDEQAAIDARNGLRRKKLFAALAGTVLLAGAGFAAYEMLYASHFVSTDNAYTAVETAQVTSAVSGIVSEVRVADTQHVKRGDVVVTLDDTDARLA